jgi:hypothetical protein
MTARSVASGLALVALVLVGSGQPGFAASREYCHRYADDAVHAQLRNIQYRCGFAGKAWSTDYGDHFSWCVSAPRAAVDREERARHGLVLACRWGS